MYLGDLHEEHVVPKPRKRGLRCSIALSILLTFLIICICHQLLEPVNPASIHASRSLQSDPHDRHPDKVVAVVQYDNPDRISLLDCYLKRDLTTNDGPLSSVIFFAPPSISPSDSQALDALISTSPHYSRFNISSTIPSPNLPTLLPLIAERSTLYITIPSTTVYIRPHALTHLITSKLAHPTQPLTIANSITAPRHHWDPSPSSPSLPTTWFTPTTLRTIPKPPLLDAETAPSRRAPTSVQGYRSLLLSRLAANIHPLTPPAALNAKDNFPAEEEEESSEARLHSAFISSLTLGRLDQWVRRSHPIAPQPPGRATSANGPAAHTFEGNMVAVWGADVLDMEIAKRGKSAWEAWMDGMALVAVLADTQVEGPEVLEQWKRYAGEMVCPPRLREEGGEEGEDGVEL